MIKLIRIPVLVVLLVLAGPLLDQYSRERMRLNAEGIVASIGPWLLLMVLAAVFLIAVAAQRDERHAGWLLTLEGVIAAVIAVVPPLVWFLALGLGIVSKAMGATSGAAYAQVLAVAWLVTVVRTGRHQRKQKRQAQQVIDAS